MGKPSINSFLIVTSLLFITFSTIVLALDDETTAIDDLDNLQLAAGNRLLPAPPPPQHDKSGRTGRLGYKQVAPLPGVGDHELTGEPVEDNEVLSSGLGMPPLPSSLQPSSTDASQKEFIISRNLSAGYDCDGVYKFCADGLSCENFSPSYHLPSAGNASTLTTSHHSKRSVQGASHLGVCSQQTCESECDLGLAPSTANSMKCPSDSYLVQWVVMMVEGGGLASADGLNLKPCCIQTCKCIPDICTQAISKHNCSFIYEKVRVGTLEPGNCCDTIQCIEDDESELERKKHKQVIAAPAVAPKTSCTVEEEGKELAHGEKWFTGRPLCEACHCQSGVRVCNRLQNCQLPFNCTDSQAEIDALPPDQCCPPCKECKNPFYSTSDYLHQPYSYRHGQSWSSPDNCNECRCTDGQAKCLSQMCQPSAVACEPNQSWTPMEGACCSPCTCTLDCGRGGYRRDPQTGMEVCDCADNHNLETLDGDDHHNHNYQVDHFSTTSPGELVQQSMSADGSVANTPSSQEEQPCLDDDSKETSCKRGGTADSSWLAIIIGTGFVIVMIIGFFVSRPYHKKICKCSTSQSNVSGELEVKYSKHLQQPNSDKQKASTTVDEEQGLMEGEIRLKKINKHDLPTTKVDNL